jgi:hypothetical protein
VGKERPELGWGFFQCSRLPGGFKAESKSSLVTPFCPVQQNSKTAAKAEITNQCTRLSHHLITMGWFYPTDG